MRIGAAGAFLGALATVLGAFVVLRPSRIQRGEELSALEAFGGGGWVLLGLWIAAAVLALLLERGLARGRAPVAAAVAVLAGATLPLGLLLAAQSAADHAATAEWARTSLGFSFWLTAFAVYLAISSALAEIRGAASRALLALVAPSAVVALIATGRLDSLSIMIEYSNFAQPLTENLIQHIAYTLGASGVALVFGLALGVLASKRAWAEKSVFSVLNVAQVMPALAFIGLVMPLMGWLRENVPLAEEFGIGGIGWAPVFIVLLLYAMYPITRKTYAAVKALDAGITDAARGMGMGPLRRVFEVELPLVAPVVLAGLRIALVQTAAGAIVAALVGGGGLGRIVFYGLEQTAQDLVLLGVLAIVGLGLLFDITLRLVGAALERRGGLGVQTTAEVGS